MSQKKVRLPPLLITMNGLATELMPAWVGWGTTMGAEWDWNWDCGSSLGGICTLRAFSGRSRAVPSLPEFASFSGKGPPPPTTTGCPERRGMSSCISSKEEEAVEWAAVMIIEIMATF